ncbi:hypothetical protein GT030_09555 [Streptomyces sp. SID1328]|nr:hypothetical protein [Streptomyces sp. SID1328]
MTPPEQTPRSSVTRAVHWEGDDLADRDQPPGIAFHVLDDDRRLTTHYRVVLRAGAGR